MEQSTRSLKRNSIANFIGLGYTSVIGIVILPFYLQYLGAEAFGLIGFFTVLQSWMLLLDMGLSPMLSRQAAKACHEGNDFFDLKRLLRSLEIIVFGIAVTIILGIALGSSWIANNWLIVTSLASNEVAISIVLMGVIIGLRQIASLYRSGIMGLENQISLNIANIIFVTLKFVGALLLLRLVTQDFVHFFVYQLFVGMLELLVLAVMFYHFLPSTSRIGLEFSWDTLKPTLPFVGGIAYTSGIWVMSTQLDKLILSNVLPLSEYGYFALVAVISTGIIQISGPISQAILPRMTYLHSRGKNQDMLALYRKSTQLMAVIMLPLAGVIAFYSTELVFAWTGDRKAAEWAGPVLFWFALGNGILAISAFQYYLQFAHGKLRMHVVFNTVSVVIQVPVIVYVAYKYGPPGVALTWFALNLITFLIWPPIVHRKFAPGIHLKWLLRDIAPVLLSTTVLLLISRSVYIDLEYLSRLGVFLILLSMGMMILTVNMFVSSAARNILFTSYGRLMK